MDAFEVERERMLEGQLRPRGIVMRRVLEAMRAVPRHLFVGHEQQALAYADEALPTAEGQTISQPYMVAVMTQELDVGEGMRVLELGTGSGYQTAILAHLVGAAGRVYTIERVANLGESARRRLEAMQIFNVSYFVGDGSAGWPRDAEVSPAAATRVPPFDRILVTAGAPAIPQPLVDQLAPRGIMVVPIGDSGRQTLRRLVKGADGKVAETGSLSCRFVPLVGEFGWKGDERMGGER